MSVVVSGAELAALYSSGFVVSNAGFAVRERFRHDGTPGERSQRAVFKAVFWPATVPLALICLWWSLTGVLAVLLGKGMAALVTNGTDRRNERMNHVMGDVAEALRQADQAEARSREMDEKLAEQKAEFEAENRPRPAAVRDEPVSRPARPGTHVPCVGFTDPDGCWHSVPEGGLPMAEAIQAVHERIMQSFYYPDLLP